MKQPSYPVKELGGLIFAYMGPDKDDPPPLPRYAPLVREDGTLYLESTRTYDYNWFNFFENAPDVSHLSILHRHSGYGKQTWGNNFFDYHNIPLFEREAIETVLKGGRPKGVLTEEKANQVIEFGCFTGVKPKEDRDRDVRQRR